MKRHSFEELVVEYHEERMNRKKLVQSGLINKILAYDKPNGALIGSGWIIYKEDGSFNNPDLFDILGNRLPEGFYTIKVTNEIHIVVIPRRVQ